MLPKLKYIFAYLSLAGLAIISFLWAIQEDTNVNTSIEIEGSLADVWKVLGDTEVFSEWNPLILEFSGEIRRRGRIFVKLEIPDAGIRTYNATLLGYQVEHEFIWEYDLPIPRLFTGKHKLIIDPMPGGGVRLRNEEELRGLLVGPLTASYLAKKRIGFEAMNRALKERVEGN
ncbi:MAG: SRPBCC domain-containing protein [Alphaproteobacteria bacterium]|nr:SRPBCC domain-containing protein [Alphaproteobacteria bacterium]